MSKHRISPIQFLTGLTLTLALATAFYTWLLYKVLRVPLRHVLSIMGLVAAVEVVAATYGYRSWLARNGPHFLSKEVRNVFSPLPVLIYLAAFGVPTFAANYLLFTGARRSATIVALVGGVIAIYGLIDFAKIKQVPASTRGASRSFHRGRSILIIFSCVLPFALAMGFVVQRELRVAATLFLVGCTTLLWALRKINAEPPPR